MANLITIVWGNYANGKIPTSALTPVIGVLAEPTTAAQVARMKADHDKATGRNLGARWGYRPFANQDSIFRDRYYVVPGKTNIKYDGKYWRKRGGVALAAVPGTSNHGYAKSFDFKDYDINWLRTHAEKYGFVNDVTSEPWHWTYRVTPTIKGSGSDIPKEEEDDMYTLADRTRDDLMNWKTTQIKNGVDALRADASEIKATLNRIEKNVALSKWALTDGSVGLRKLVGGLIESVAALQTGANGEFSTEQLEALSKSLSETNIAAVTEEINKTLEAQRSETANSVAAELAARLAEKPKPE